MKQNDFVRMTGLSLPPIPVLTQWGTWLKAVDYHLTDYTKIKQFILTYKPDSKYQAFDCLNKIMSGNKLEKHLFQLRKYTSLAFVALIMTLKKWI